MWSKRRKRQRGLAANIAVKRVIKRSRLEKERMKYLLEM